jgi:GT2 family glycosyltransferase
MKYSIVIPSLTKDEEHKKVLETCLKSVSLNSDSCEVILVDDGSPVDITGYNEVDKYLRHDPNRGIARSWNDGCVMAEGEYVAIINDDITVQKGWLDKLANALDFDTDYWVAAPGVTGKQTGTGIEEDYKWFPGYCFMLKKETLVSMGGFDEQFSPFNYEDTDMWTRILQLGAKLVRNYSTEITHLEGHVLHTLAYEEVSEKNRRLFVAKHGFDPIPIFYGDKEGPWVQR